MSAKEIAAVIIDSSWITNDLARIDSASVAGQHLQYVLRDLAENMAQSGDRGEWNALAKAPALFVIVDGVRYRRTRGVSPIGFPCPSASEMAAVG